MPRIWRSSWTSLPMFPVDWWATPADIGEPLAFDLRLLVEQVAELWEPQADAKDLEIIVDFPPHVPRRLVGDAGRIRQVLTKLTGNAVKFTHKGHVRISVECAGRTPDNVQI